MTGEAQIKVLEQWVQALITSEPDLFIVEIRIKPINNIKVFIDGDQGISIEKLVSYNRKLYKVIEENEMFPNGDFSLEVSSPGLDEPLKLNRQYQKNIGRFVEVSMIDGTKVEGKLLATNETGISVEEERGKNKKKEIIQHELLFNNIKNTKIQIKF
jgi:ribosome maturation factor RimP